MPLRSDPTRTTMLRRQFVADMRRRFKSIAKSVRELVVDLDVFGLSGPVSFLQAVSPGVWRFRTDPQKVQAFRDWLQEQVDRKILTVDHTGKPWTASYIDSAYRKGVVRAFEDVRKEALSEGADFYAGTKEEFLRSAFAQPERLSKIELLATRAFEDLRGVGSTMGQQLSRELASGLAHGLNPMTIAKGMTERIGNLTRTRAELIAQTEIIAAHAEGQLDSFQDLGVEEVGVLAEWSTAGDDRVCERCGAMEGQLLTIEEARGMIPIHPRCRCTWIPSTVARAKDRKKNLLAAVKGSIRAERKKGSLKQAIAKSTWAGKNLL